MFRVIKLFYGKIMYLVNVFSIVLIVAAVCYIGTNKSIAHPSRTPWFTSRVAVLANHIHTFLSHVMVAYTARNTPSLLQVVYTSSAAFV